MAVANLGAQGTLSSRVGRINARLSSVGTPKVGAANNTTAAGLFGPSQTLLAATPADCLLYGYTVQPASQNTQYTLRFLVGDQVRVGDLYHCTYDSKGNLFWYERGNSTIRRMDAVTRQVTTFVGTGTAGHTNGTGTGAAIANTYGLCVDSQDNLILPVSAPGTFVGVRMVTPAGVVTTIAGQAGTGNADGTGAAASFTSPFSACTDSADNIYIADWDAYRLRKVTQAGVVTTLAGGGTSTHADGTGTGASFIGPKSVKYDPFTDTLVVADGNRIRRVTLAGVVTTIAGTATASSNNGPIASATFNNPFDTAIPNSSDIYVMDTGYIRKISGGQVTTIAGTGTQTHNDGWNNGGNVFHYWGIALHPNGTQIAAGGPGNTGRIKLIDLDPNGYNQMLVGDGTIGIVNGIAEMPIAEVTYGQVYSSQNGSFVAPYMPLPGPVRLPAGSRLAVALATDSTGSVTLQVRANLVFAKTLE
jgi:hypothetical protein